MVKTSWWWKRIVFLLATGKTKLTKLLRVLRQLRFIARSGKLRKALGWFGCSLMAMLMLRWNFGLLLATLTGIGIMLLVYRLQLGIWQNYLLTCQRFLNTVSGKLSLSVACGAIASFTTYLGATVWIHSSNRWLATGLIFQGLGTLLTLFLIVWQFLTRQVKRDEATFEQLLVQLTDNSSLRRLIAVRQLSKLVNDPNIQTSYRSQLQEYFQLMLTVEQESVIRENLLQNLQNWSEQPKPSQQKQPINIPLALKKSLYI